MQKSARARAEERFAATQKKGKEALNEKEKARQEITKRMAKQKALRLAKEAADKEAAATVEAATEAADSETPPRLPQVHRR
jgi:hypothetical protein